MLERIGGPRVIYPAISGLSVAYYQPVFGMQPDAILDVVQLPENHFGPYTDRGVYKGVNAIIAIDPPMTRYRVFGTEMQEIGPIHTFPDYQMLAYFREDGKPVIPTVLSLVRQATGWGLHIGPQLSQLMDQTRI